VLPPQGEAQTGRELEHARGLACFYGRPFREYNRYTHHVAVIRLFRYFRYSMGQTVIQCYSYRSARLPDIISCMLTDFVAL
jgi:hypothetical protein